MCDNQLCQTTIVIRYDAASNNGSSFEVHIHFAVYSIIALSPCEWARRYRVHHIVPGRQSNANILPNVSRFGHADRRSHWTPHPRPVSARESRQFSVQCDGHAKRHCANECAPSETRYTQSKLHPSFFSLSLV